MSTAPKPAHKPWHKPYIARKTGSSTTIDMVGRKNTKTGGAGHLRDKTTIRRLEMYKYKPQRTRHGRIIKKQPITDGRIEPDRRWFGNTRTIDSLELEKFREELGARVHDPYSVVLKSKKVPTALLEDSSKRVRPDILAVETFEDTFGPKKQRKRPKLGVFDYGTLMSDVSVKDGEYNEEGDVSKAVDDDEPKDAAREWVLDAGQSRRIWSELYKVIDSSDVIIQVLDARNPQGTRSRQIEATLKGNRKHKHMIFVLNKCDLVPTDVTSKWIKLLSREYPTLAFHASISNPFGKGPLIQLLRQLAQLHKDKPQISVGMVGFPNVGKSSIINALRKKKVCTVAPIPGETKIWQYVNLFNNVFLIDCPGVVHENTTDSAEDIVMKGVVRFENLQDPAQYVPPVLAVLKKQHVINTYGIEEWEDAEDMMKQLAKKTGKLLKGGEPDFRTVARIILNDFTRGKLPYYMVPPAADEEGEEVVEEEVHAEKEVVEEEEQEEVEEEKEKEEEEENPLEDIEWEDVYGQANAEDEVGKESDGRKKVLASTRKQQRGSARKMAAATRQKEPRMKTMRGQKIGNQFYRDTNVKNKRSRR